MYFAARWSSWSLPSTLVDRGGAAEARPDAADEQRVGALRVGVAQHVGVLGVAVDRARGHVGAGERVRRGGLEVRRVAEVGGGGRDSTIVAPSARNCSTAARSRARMPGAHAVAPVTSRSRSSSRSARPRAACRPGAATAGSTRARAAPAASAGQRTGPAEHAEQQRDVGHRAADRARVVVETVSGVAP